MNPSSDQPWTPAPELLAAFADGELDSWADGAALRCRINEWLAAHPEAAADIEAQLALSRLLAVTKPVEPGPAAWNRAWMHIEKARLQGAKRSRAVWRLAGLVVAGAAAVVVLVLMSRQPAAVIPQAPHQVVAQSPVEGPEVLQVAGADEVNVLYVAGADTKTVVVGHLPWSGPMVRITVVVILASDRCKCIDPRLKEIACELQKASSKLTGFTLVSMTEMSLPANGNGGFVCIEDTCVEVAVNKCVDANNKVCLTVTAPLQDKVIYDTICGKFCLIVTRYQAAERIPPTWVAQALGQAIGGGPVVGPLMSAGTLLEGRTKPRLVLAVRAQPCNGK